MKSNWHHAINHCFAIAVIIVQNDRVVFKHELYRRTIEESLSVLRRIELNKMILDLFLDSFKEKDEIERILHYAKNANEKKLVFKYAPEVATKAASTGAHKEAAKLYLTAIEYFEDDDITQLAKFYEAYAYESYLSNQIIEARDATEKALKIWQQKLFIEKIAGSLQFLSRLYWISGNGQMAASFAERAVEMLKDQTASATKAMALLNMSDLLLNAGDLNLCMERAEKAMAMAKETGNEDIAAQALANIGAAQVFDHSSAQTGITILHQSLEVALKNSFYEAAAHCYTNLACSLVRMKNYSSAARILEEGTAYCEERHLSFWSACLLSWKARLLLETSEWTEAWNIADNLLKSEEQPGVITINALLVIARISVRQGREAFHLLLEAKTNPLVIEPQWTFPLTAAMLEYEWLTGKKILNNDDIQRVEVLLTRAATPAEKKEFDFWMNKTGRRNLPFKDSVEGTYEKALVLFDGRDDDKRKALTIVQNLDAMATYEKLKQEMRTLGINNIPRGLRSSTRSNAAFLTDREMDVLHLLKEELHNREIAAQLFISAKTVDHHISNILFKLDAATRAKAVSKAVSMGII
jgi:DNA-binding CsgD family transcriptional regulator